MIFKIKKRTNPFTMIDTRALNDRRLSWKAKGLHAYLLGKPQDWHVRLSDLLARSPDGAGSIRSALVELRRAGYAKLETVRAKDGRLRGTHWEIYEQPVELDLGAATEIAVFRNSVKPRLGKTETRRIAP